LIILSERETSIPASLLSATLKSMN